MALALFVVLNLSVAKGKHPFDETLEISLAGIRTWRVGQQGSFVGKVRLHSVEHYVYPELSLRQSRSTKKDLDNVIAFRTTRGFVVLNAVKHPCDETLEVILAG